MVKRAGHEGRAGLPLGPVVGAVLGVALALVWMGGWVAVLDVLLALLAGGLVGSAIEAAAQAVHGRRVPASGDHGDAPGYGLVRGTGADAQRTEAGHVSPST